MKNGKKIRGFSYSKSMAYFEAFPWNISSSINFLFLKSEKISFFKKLTACWIFLNSFLLVPRGTNEFGLSILMGVEWDGDPSWTHWKKPKDNTLIIICFKLFSREIEILIKFLRKFYKKNTWSMNFSSIRLSYKKFSSPNSELSFGYLV